MREIIHFLKSDISLLGRFIGLPKVIIISLSVAVRQKPQLLELLAG